MRIERWSESVARLSAGAALALLAACPGTLSNQEEFEAYASAANDAGTTSYVAGSSGATGNVGRGGSSVAAGGFAGGGSQPVGSDGCGDVVQRILEPSCGGAGCHGPSKPQQELDLVSPGVLQRVVGKQGKQCLGLLADPEHPEQGLIYQKLLPKPSCGVRMPIARPALSEKDVACVLSWLAGQRE